MNRRALGSGIAAAVMTLLVSGSPAAAAVPQLTHTGSDPSWYQTSAALWIGVAVLFVGLVVGLTLALAPRVARSQIAGASIKGVRNGSVITTLGEHATRAAERSLSRNERGSNLNRALERAGIAMRPSEFVVLATTATFAVFALTAAFANLILALVFGALVPIACRSGLAVLAQRRSEKFADQLEQTLPLMGGSLRAGFGIMQAFDAVARESEAPTSEEFHRLVVEARVGRDVHDALNALADRVNSEDFDWVVQAIEIHRQVGGDLAQVLDNVYATIRDRNRIRRQIKALSAEGRFSALILLILPVAMLAVITIINPTYISELTTHSIGVAMLIAAAGFMVVGGLWLKRITRLVF